MTKHIVLPRGLDCMVSDCDYAWARKYTWYVNRDVTGKAYVCRYEKNKRIYMHREITDCPKGFVVDHVNGNSLDNRRENMRVCVQRDNTRNNAPYGAVDYKGVYIKRKGHARAYAARISAGDESERLFLGYFGTAKAAADAYDRAALILFGEFAWINTPIETLEGIYDEKHHPIPF